MVMVIVITNMYKCRLISFFGQFFTYSFLARKNFEIVNFTSNFL